MTSRFDGVITPLHRHKEGQLRGAFDDAKFGAVAEIELLGSNWRSWLRSRARLYTHACVAHRRHSYRQVGSRTEARPSIVLATYRTHQMGSRMQN